MTSIKKAGQALCTTLVLSSSSFSQPQKPAKPAKALGKGMLFATLSAKQHTHLIEGFPAQVNKDHSLAFLAQAAVTDYSLIEVEITGIKKLFLESNPNTQPTLKRLQSILLVSGYRRFLTDWLSIAVGFFNTYNMGKVEVLSGSTSDDETDFKPDYHTNGFSFSSSVLLPHEIVWQQSHYSPRLSLSYSIPTSTKGEPHYSISLGIRRWVR